MKHIVLVSSRLFLVFLIVFITTVRNDEIRIMDDEKDPDEEKLYYGLDKDKSVVLQDLVGNLKKARAKRIGVKLSDSEIKNPLIGDVALTPSQARHFLEEEQELSNTGRDKRHSIDFERFQSTRWDLPIRYSIQRGYFTKSDKKKIHRAVKRWQELTCLRFEEDRKYKGRKIKFRGDQEGCWSFVGKRNDLIRQTINLKAPECTLIYGVIVHEIGHAIGLYHMEDMPYRDKYIKVIKKNVLKGLEVNLIPVSPKDTHRYGISWDYASLMQFRRDSFSFDGKAFTILPKDPNYFYTTGMVNDVSFFDATVVNRAYKCQDYCDSKNVPNLDCKNHGYPNPGIGSECTTCLCPTGLGGDCSGPAEGSKGCNPKSSVITVTDEGGCLESPGYKKGRRYSLGDTCSWILQGPAGKGIKFYFDTTGGFGLYHYNVSGGMCSHFVEIKFNGNFTEPGKRYCGSEDYIYDQNEVLLTYTNTALVHFNALSDAFLDKEPSKFVGFRLCYKTSKKFGKKCNKIDKATGECKRSRR